MKSSIVTKIFEFSILAMNDEELIFKLEILMLEGNFAQPYYGQLYRLEMFKFRARDFVTDNTEWEDSDYRCWVMEDALGVDEYFYSSVDEVKDAVVKRLEMQLGIG